MILFVLLTFLCAIAGGKNITSTFLPGAKYLFNRDAITVVFSNAVVKLGFESMNDTNILQFVGLPENFPGRARWCDSCSLPVVNCSHSFSG
jgi:hypothetical protein